MKFNASIHRRREAAELQMIRLVMPATYQREGVMLKGSCTVRGLHAPVLAAQSRDSLTNSLEMNVRQFFSR